MDSCNIPLSDSNISAIRSSQTIHPVFPYPAVLSGYILMGCPINSKPSNLGHIVRSYVCRIYPPGILISKKAAKMAAGVTPHFDDLLCAWLFTSSETTIYRFFTLLQITLYTLFTLVPPCSQNKLSMYGRRYCADHKPWSGMRIHSPLICRTLPVPPFPLPGKTPLYSC